MDEEEFVRQLYNQKKEQILRDMLLKRQDIQEKKLNSERIATEYAKGLLNPPIGLRKRFVGS